MRILFICGSLEPGRDGVGDYTRRLAGELTRQGQKVTLLAINDDFLTETLIGAQEDNGTSLEVIRIATSLASHKRFEQAKEWIEDFKPEWISLQYVPFSFHRKGLPLSLSSKLSKIGKGVRWHIMFHELWVGMESDSSFKFVIWGWVQKHLIKSFTGNLNPSLIHTQTLLYQTLLEKLGFNPRYLPLFGNIPVVNSEFQDKRADNILIGFNSCFSLVLFGTIHPGVPVQSFAEEAAAFSKKNKVEIKLVIVGRTGSEQGKWASIWEAAGLKVELMGEQTPERISEILSSSLAGISTTPLALLEKSGSVAAMREHGLSVLCVRPYWAVKGISNFSPLSGIIEYRIGNFENCFKKIKPISVQSTLQEIGRKLVDDFTFEENMRSGKSL